MTLLVEPQLTYEQIESIFLREIEKTAVYSFDIEHDPAKRFNYRNFDLWGVSIAVGDYVWYLKGEDGKRIINVAFQLDTTSDGREIEAVAHNGKYDLKCIRAAKWIKDGRLYPKHFRCTMIAVNVLNEKKPPKQLGLKLLVKERYNYDMLTFEEASIDGQDSDIFKRYATDDSRYTLKLWLDDKPRIIEAKLWKYYTRIITRVCFAFTDMELAGNKWDFQYGEGLLYKLCQIRDELRIDIFAELGTLNLNSGDQLAKRLFDDMGLDTVGIAKTKGGKRWAVDEKSLKILAIKHEICAKISDYRSANKMLNTYVEPLTRMAMDDPDGRIHPTIWPTSANGRTREDDPNLQNVPIFLSKKSKVFEGLHIRNCFIAPPGRKLLVADYSQLELRMAAHITQDPIFLKAYRTWQCNVCSATGEHHKLLRKCPKCGTGENEHMLNLKKYPDAKGFWHGLDLHQITANDVSVLHGDRALGKICNFALIYKATAWKMNLLYPDMSIEEWEIAIEQFMERYSGVYAWHIRMESALNASGVCRCLFGRRRRVERWEIDKAYKHALNMFINFPPSASAQSLGQLGIINLREHWLEKDYWERVLLFLNYVHDEVVFEVDDNKIEECSIDVQDKMENVTDFLVPMRIDIKIVDRWGNAKAA